MWKLMVVTLARLERPIPWVSPWRATSIHTYRQTESLTNNLQYDRQTNSTVPGAWSRLLCRLWSGSFGNRMGHPKVWQPSSRLQFQCRDLPQAADTHPCSISIPPSRRRSKTPELPDGFNWLNYLDTEIRERRGRTCLFNEEEEQIHLLMMVLLLLLLQRPPPSANTWIISFLYRPGLKPQVKREEKIQNATNETSAHNSCVCVHLSNTF